VRSSGCLDELFLVAHHERSFDAMDSTGQCFTALVLGQLVTMLIVEVMSPLAYWWIGLLSPLAPALVAGVTKFIHFSGHAGSCSGGHLAPAIDLETIF